MTITGASTIRSNATATGRRLVAISQTSPAIAFVPDAPGIELLDDALVLGGDMNAPMIRTLLAALDAGQSRLVIRVNNG